MDAPSSEVALPGPVKVSLKEPLDDLDQALRLSEALSRSELVPRSLYGKPANILHVLLTGQSLGLHWSESLRVIYSPGPGQVGMRGQFLLARLRQAGHRYSFEEGDDWCVFRLRRKDEEEPFEARFTVEDAVQAGLARRNAAGELVALSRDSKPLPWQMYTRKMLRWRAVSDCVAFAAPEVLLGFEVEGDMPPEPPQQVQLQPQTPAPPGPDAGEAAAGEGQAEQARRLAALDGHTRRGPEPDRGTGSRETRPGPEDEGARPGEGSSGGAPAALTSLTGGRPVDEAAVQEDTPQEEPGPLDREQQAEVARAFASVNWSPGQFRADVLRACSVFCRRPVAAAAQLRHSEAARLIAALAQVRQQDDGASPEVRMADAVARWGHEWQEADPAGFTAWQEEQD